MTKTIALVLCIAAVVVALIAHSMNSPKVNSIAICLLSVAVILATWK